MKLAPILRAVEKELGPQLASLGLTQVQPGRYERIGSCSLQWLVFFPVPRAERFNVLYGAAPLEVASFGYCFVDHQLRDMFGYPAGDKSEVRWSLRDAVAIGLESKVQPWFEKTSQWAGLRDELRTVSTTWLAVAVCEARLGNREQALALIRDHGAADPRKIDWVDDKRAAGEALAAALENGSEQALLDSWRAHELATRASATG